MRKIVASSVAALVLTLPQVSAAGDNTNCVYAPGVFNAPQGALIVNQASNPNGTDPVTAVLTAIGEQSTHSAMSHGTYGQDGTNGSWVSMDTMVTPQQYPNGASSCSTPVDAYGLADGEPGARTDNTGGAWGFYFGSGGWMAGQNYIKYITPGSGRNNGGSRGYNDAQAATCLSQWEKNDMAGCGGYCMNGHGYGVNAYQTLSSQYDSNFLDVSGPWVYDGNSSYPPNYTSGSLEGTMCSGLISTAYYHGADSGGACAGNAITQYTYSNSQVFNASWSLYNTIQNNTQGFWGTLGACIACFDCNLLDEAGDQVVNAFNYMQVYWVQYSQYPGWWYLQPYAGMGGHSWASNGVSGQTATTISPDRLAGWGAHATSTNNSPWKPYPSTNMTFSSGGSYYGCWHE